MNISKTDYIKILKYYNIKIDKNMSYKEIKEKSENILATKLCKCIKSVNNYPICINNVINKKNLKSTGFSCKKYNFKNNLRKTKRNLKI
jgi:hypothetical protein